MSLIALITDPHFKTKTFFDKITFTQKVMDKCKEKKVDYILNCGDTFDTGNPGDKLVSTDTQINYLEKVFNNNIPTITLEGNHDQYGDKNSALNLIHFSNWLKIQDKVEIFKFSDFELACIPWIRNREDYRELVLSELNKAIDYSRSKTRILIGHLNIINCSMGKHGLCSPNNYFSFNIEDLINSNFSPTHLFFGHIHMKYDIPTKNKNIVAKYLGALTQLRFDDDEGKEAGFHLFDTETGLLQFINMDEYASKYYTIKEEDLSLYNLEKDYIRLYTEEPEKYKGLKNVKALYLNKETLGDASSVYEEAASNELNIDNLTKRFCSLKTIEEPKSLFYIQEKAKLSLGLTKKDTGFDRINSIKLKNVGIHKNINLKFKDGFTCITGNNGSGKSTLIDSIVSALFENTPSRGNIKNLMQKGSFIELHVEACDKPYRVHKALTGSQCVSTLNDIKYTLVKGFKAAVEPIFGDANLFNKLVILDQGAEYDLVTADDTARLELLRKLFDLNSFDVLYKHYTEQMKELKYKLYSIEKLEEEVKKLQVDLREISSLEINLEDPTEEITALTNRITELKKLKIAYDQNVIKHKEIETIAKFEKENNVEEVRNIVGKIARLRGMLTGDLNWDKIGCKDKPLPCIFIKQLTKTPEELNAISLELEELDKKINMREWKEYSYLKNKHPKEVTITENSWNEVEYDECYSKLIELKENKVKYDQTKSLLNLKLRFEQQLEGKLKELHLLGDSNEVSARIVDLQFLIYLCSKHGLSLYLINLICGELQEILNDLIDKADLSIKVTLSTFKTEELDTLKILFGSEKYDIKHASGGEIGLVRILFKLAIMIYLNRYFGTYKVLILDEPCAALDSDNTDSVLMIIDKLKKEFNQLIIVSHSNKFVAAADTVISL